jgi:hypothetical protein
MMNGGIVEFELMMAIEEGWIWDSNEGRKSS